MSVFLINHIINYINTRKLNNNDTYLFHSTYVHYAIATALYVITTWSYVMSWW